MARPDTRLKWHPSPIVLTAGTFGIRLLHLMEPRLIRLLNSFQGYLAVATSNSSGDFFGRRSAFHFMILILVIKLLCRLKTMLLALPCCYHRNLNELNFLNLNIYKMNMCNIIS